MGEGIYETPPFGFALPRALMLKGNSVYVNRETDGNDERGNVGADRRFGSVL